MKMMELIEEYVERLELIDYCLKNPFITDEQRTELFLQKIELEIWFHVDN